MYQGEKGGDFEKASFAKSTEHEGELFISYPPSRGFQNLVGFQMIGNNLKYSGRKATEPFLR